MTGQQFFLCLVPVQDLHVGSRAGRKVRRPVLRSALRLRSRSLCNISAVSFLAVFDRIIAAFNLRHCFGHEAQCTDFNQVQIHRLVYQGLRRAVFRPRAIHELVQGVLRIWRTEFVIRPRIWYLWCSGQNVRSMQRNWP